MKKIISIIVLIIVLAMSMYTLTGCTLQIETTENSVSASVDGDTTERIDSIIDWIKSRLSRIFTTTDNSKDSKTSSNTTKITTNI